MWNDYAVQRMSRDRMEELHADAARRRLVKELPSTARRTTQVLVGWRPERLLPQLRTWSVRRA